jgi:ribosome maturation factor RimP
VGKIYHPEKTRKKSKTTDQICKKRLRSRKELKRKVGAVFKVKRHSAAIQSQKEETKKVRLAEKEVIILKEKQKNRDCPGKIYFFKRDDISKANRTKKTQRQ